MKQLNILHCVESYFPSQGGMPEVVKEVSERLVALGHRVTVATSKNAARIALVENGVTIKAFDVSGNWTNGISGETEKYMAFLKEDKFDVICFFAAQQWALDAALDILPELKAKKICVPTGYSGFYKEDYKPYYERMKTWIHYFDRSVYLSNHYRDIDFARKEGVNNFVIIPNGAAEDEFLPESKINVRKRLHIPEKQFFMLLVGSYTGVKGHKEAVKIFLQSNIKNATLLMIGNRHVGFLRQYIRYPWFLWSIIKGRVLKNKRIIFNAYPRDFTVAAYQQANLFLFPSNIECSPIVLFECAAARLPFLATDVGNTVEIAAWTNGGKILPTVKDQNGFSHADIEGSAQLLDAVYKDAAGRKQMAEISHAIWKEKFSWEKITLQYEALYLEVTGKA